MLDVIDWCLHVRGGRGHFSEYPEFFRPLTPFPPPDDHEIQSLFEEYMAIEDERDFERSLGISGAPGPPACLQLL